MTAIATLSRKPHKPLAPANVTLGRLAYHRGRGVGVIDIVAADGSSQPYLMAAVRDANGKLLGVRLTKPADGAQHDVDMTVRPWRCDCPDAVRRPERPGGCKHVAALWLAAEQLRAGGGPG